MKREPEVLDEASRGGGAARVARGFGHVETWVFDLDKTLYAADCDLWPKIDTRITAYICEMFGLDGLSARALQKHWYLQHGTTLRALMDLHDIDPHEFLAFCHDIDRASLAPAPLLGAAIGRLPGRKLILTNGSRRHAEDTARALGIDEHFEDIFDIAAADFEPKPARGAYEKFLTRHGVDPARAAMFEDIDKNLLVPHALGMTTVLVVGRGDPDHAPSVAPRAHVDWETEDLTAFLAALEIAGPR